MLNKYVKQMLENGVGVVNICITKCVYRITIYSKQDLILMSLIMLSDRLNNFNYKQHMIQYI